ncbi:MAG: metalloregulator ArsR/SmtB family transcription factor [Burkholderiales bacterium]|nr:metalloregulator ArsR/SmtB family transcription factor [Burkholderiales bacterium]
MDVQATFDALADATRRRILALLIQENELCVCELSTALDEIQPKISRHLGVLKDAGVVTPRRNGTWIFYRLAEEMPQWAKALLLPLTAGAVAEFKADRKRLIAWAGRPERDTA